MRTIIVATNNEGKQREIKEILKEYKLISLKEANCEIKIEEDKDSFEENSKKKANFLWLLCCFLPASFLIAKMTCQIL